MTDIIPDGTYIERDGKTFVSDDGELVEIACSHPDMETAIEALHQSVRQQ